MTKQGMPVTLCCLPALVRGSRRSREWGSRRSRSRERSASSACRARKLATRNPTERFQSRGREFQERLTPGQAPLPRIGPSVPSLDWWSACRRGAVHVSEGGSRCRLWIATRLPQCRSASCRSCAWRQPLFRAIRWQIVGERTNGCCDASDSCGAIRRWGGNVLDLRDCYKISFESCVHRRTISGPVPDQNGPAMHCWLGGLPEICQSHYNWPFTT